MKFLKPHVACATHAYLLIILGVYQFTDSGAVIELLMPVIFGVPILTQNSGVQYGTKSSVNISLVLSFLSVIVLVYFFISGLKTIDYLEVGMKSLIIVTGVVAFVSLLLFKIERNRRMKKVV